MLISDITVKNALVKSRIPGADFVVNPYLGCGHGCSYCYAVFMRKYARHHQKVLWGEFVEAKVNIVQVLEAEVRRRKRPGRVMLASVCDAYQPLEARYRLTRGCLEVLGQAGWGIDILSRSPLVTRDLDLLTTFPDVSVGLSIPTNDDAVRRVLEPRAPSIPARVAALKTLHEAGLHPWVFIAPMLPLDPDKLYHLIGPYVSRVMADRLNYASQVRALFHRHGWDYALTEGYAAQTRAQLHRLFSGQSR